MYERIVDRAIAASGTCSGEHGSGIGERRTLLIEAGPAIGVTHALKQTLDPHGLLNRGKALLEAAPAGT